MTDELEEGKHSKTSVLKLSSLTLGKDVIGQVQNAGGGREPTIGLDASNECNNLHPSEEGDDLNRSNTIGDVVRVDGTIGDHVVSETVSLGGDVTKDGKLGDTSVLELGEAVFVEPLLGDSVGEASGIPEAGWGKSTDLVLEGVEGGDGLANGGRSEGGGRASHGSEDSELHHDVIGEIGNCLIVGVVITWMMLVPEP